MTGRRNAIGNQADHSDLGLAEQLLLLGEVTKEFRQQAMNAILLLRSSHGRFQVKARQLNLFLDQLELFRSEVDDIACSLFSINADPKNICCRVFYGDQLSVGERAEYLQYVRKHIGADDAAR